MSTGRPHAEGRRLVVGAGGMLGHDLMTALAGRDVTAPTRSQLDIRELDAVAAAVVGHDVVVNRAAWTAVVDAGVPAGTYHCTASGETTWFGLARRVFELLRADPERVRPTTTDGFPRPAPRPAYSVLGHEAWRAAGMDPMRDWDVALRAAWPVLRPDALVGA